MTPAVKFCLSFAVVFGSVVCNMPNGQKTITHIGNLVTLIGKFVRDAQLDFKICGPRKTFHSVGPTLSQKSWNKLAG